MFKRIFNWIYQKKIREVDLLVKKAQDVINTPAKKEFITVKSFDITDIQYLGKIHELINSNEFIFHISTVKNNLVSKMICGENAAEIQNQLIGIDYLVTSALRASSVYTEMTAGESNE